MKNKYAILSGLVFVASLVITLNACSPDKAPAAPEVAKNYDYKEEFDTVARLYSQGWLFNNRSVPQGAATWQQGVYVSGKFGPDGFPAFSYTASADEYLFAGYQSGNGLATIDSWAMTPELMMKNGDEISFYTRTFTGSTFPDHLEVRLNAIDESVDIGTGNGVGKFTTVLADINPNLATGGYPETWTKYTYTVQNLPGLMKKRVAFRYYVTGGGPSGANSNAIGIDLFEFDSK
jgi:hypothetical protein